MTKTRNIEDEKELARMLGRDEVSLQVHGPYLLRKAGGCGRALCFPGQGHINSMEAFAEKLFKLPDPDDDRLYGVIASLRGSKG